MLAYLCLRLSGGIVERLRSVGVGVEESRTHGPPYQLVEGKTGGGGGRGAGRRRLVAALSSASGRYGAWGLSKVNIIIIILVFSG